MAFGFAHAAAAQENQEENRGPYFGVSIGSFDFEQDSPIFGIHVEDTAPAYRIFGGYRFNEHFALEGGWGETGNLEDGVTVPGSVLDLRIDLKGEYEVFTVRALGILPLSEKVSLYGGIGYYDAELDAVVTTNSFVRTYDVEDGADGATLVGGVDFKLERMNIRAEIEKFDEDSPTPGMSTSESCSGSSLGAGAVPPRRRPSVRRATNRWPQQLMRRRDLVLGRERAFEMLGCV